MTEQSCLEKQAAVKQLFAACISEESKYERIIALGKGNPPLNPEDKVPVNLVAGCQSMMYLHSFLENGVVHFAAESDALISSGLAAILIKVYSGEPPEVILKCPPTYLEELGIHASLTPNRSNGLYSIHLRMKQEALKFYMQLQKGSG